MKMEYQNKFSQHSKNWNNTILTGNTSLVLDFGSTVQSPHLRLSNIQLNLHHSHV